MDRYCTIVAEGIKTPIELISFSILSISYAQRFSFIRLINFQFLMLCRRLSWLLVSFWARVKYRFCRLNPYVSNGQYFLGRITSTDPVSDCTSVVKMLTTLNSGHMNDYYSPHTVPITTLINTVVLSNCLRV